MQNDTKAEEPSVTFNLNKVHQMIADLDEALAPYVKFNRDYEIMKEEADKKTRELVNKVRCGLARNHGVNYPTI